jgi:hypothetical protein
MKDVASNVKAHCRTPLDQRRQPAGRWCTLFKITGFKAPVVGMAGVLDTARFKFFVAGR